MWNRPSFWLIAAIFLTCGISIFGAAKFNRVLEIGVAAPDWRNLPGTDGKSHSLADYRKPAILVLIFIRNHCPVAQAYEARLAKFTAEFQPRSVELVAVNVSRAAGETLEKMKTRAEAQGFNFPYLRDESQQIGRDYGASATPNIFVLDRDRKIAYMGAYDDHTEASKVTRRYVVDAVEALLAGRPVAIKESLPRGCALVYDPAE